MGYYIANLLRTLYSLGRKFCTQTENGISYCEAVVCRTVF